MASVTNWYPGVFGYDNKVPKASIPFTSIITPKKARNRIEGEYPGEHNPDEPPEPPKPQEKDEGPDQLKLPPGRGQIADKPFTGPHAPDPPRKTPITGTSKSSELPPGTSKVRGPHAPEPPRGPSIEGRPSRTDRQRALPGPERANNGGGIQVEQLPINRDRPSRPELSPNRPALPSSSGHLHDDHSDALARVTQENAEDRSQGPLEMGRPKAIERRKLLDGRPLGAIKMSSPWERQHPGSKTGLISEGHVGNLLQNQASREGGFSDLATREEGNLYYPKGEHEPKFPTEAPRGR